MKNLVNFHYNQVFLPGFFSPRPRPAASPEQKKFCSSSQNHFPAA
jgi:hypothetical protein